MVTVTMLLIGAAFVLTIASGAGYVPLWVPVLLLALAELLRLLPL